MISVRPITATVSFGLELRWRRQVRTSPLRRIRSIKETGTCTLLGFCECFANGEPILSNCIGAKTDGLAMRNKRQAWIVNPKFASTLFRLLHADRAKELSVRGCCNTRPHQRPEDVADRVRYSYVRDPCCLVSSLKDRERIVSLASADCGRFPSSARKHSRRNSLGPVFKK